LRKNTKGWDTKKSFHPFFVTHLLSNEYNRINPAVERIYLWYEQAFFAQKQKMVGSCTTSHWYRDSDIATDASMAFGVYNRSLINRCRNISIFERWEMEVK